MFVKNAVLHMRIEFGQKNVKVSVLNIMHVPSRLPATLFN